MAITLEAIRAAGGIVHSDGNIFFRDISMLQGLAGAAPALEAPAAPACPYTGFAARYWTLGYQGHDCPPTTGPVSREAYDAGARAALAAAPQAPAAPVVNPSVTWTSADDGLPEHGDLVLCDFGPDYEGGGIQFGYEVLTWDEHHTVAGVARWLKLDRMPESLADHTEIDRLMAAPAAPAVDAPGERDAAFEAVRKRLCGLPRYSFVLDDDGVVRREQDRIGNWIEFDDAHELFDPVAVDAAIAAQAAAKGAGDD